MTTVAQCPELKYVLRLYVTGTTPRSQQAVANVRDICEEYLRGRYRLEVIDVYQRPLLASAEQIVVLPTLVKELPLPMRRFVGDLSDPEKVLVGLDLKPAEV
jgi:circadian clock protein KaiB